MIAALYVETGGVYYGLPDVDPWDEARDARKYAGPHPVVAHPPCARWGRYWGGSPTQKVRLRKGDDEGCFAAALTAVRRFGGVLEHPEASGAWFAFGLRAPPRGGPWVTAGDFYGWTCCVEQGHYGHRAKKATWLYAVRVKLPSLKWGSCGERIRLDSGFHSAEERRRAVKRGIKELLAKSERARTPESFRDLLLDMARSVKQEAIAA